MMTNFVVKQTNVIEDIIFIFVKNLSCLLTIYMHYTRTSRNVLLLFVYNYLFSFKCFHIIQALDQTSASRVL